MFTQMNQFVSGILRVTVFQFIQNTASIQVKYFTLLPLHISVRINYE